jgi:hypothetical protein
MLLCYLALTVLAVRLLHTSRARFVDLPTVRTAIDLKCQTLEVDLFIPLEVDFGS